MDRTGEREVTRGLKEPDRGPGIRWGDRDGHAGGERFPKQEVEGQRGPKQVVPILVEGGGDRPAPGARGVDDQRGGEFEVPAGELIHGEHPGGAPGLHPKFPRLDVVERRAPGRGDPSEHLDDEAMGALHHRVTPEGRSSEGGPPTAGEVFEGLGMTEDPTRRDVSILPDRSIPIHGEQVVHAQGEAKNRGTVKALAIQRHQTRKGAHELGKRLEPPPSLHDGPAETPEIETLQVAQPTMDDPKAVRGRFFTEVGPLDEQRSEPPSRAFEGHGDAVDTSPDHDDVVGLVLDRGWFASDHGCIGRHMVYFLHDN